MKPRQIVHSLLILSEAIIISCCLIMIIKYDRTSDKEDVWMGSKILTFEKEIKKNNYNLFPILSIRKIMNIFYNIQEKNVKIIIKNVEYLIH